MRHSEARQRAGKLREESNRSFRVPQDDGVFKNIVSLENLFVASREFSKGKRKKRDVQQFEFNFEDELLGLHEELVAGRYKVRPYSSFYLSDPKLRHIHKATVRDRVLFQAVFRVLYPIFNPSFIFDSYASRASKGTHAGVDRLEQFLIKASKNNWEKVWALKCDVSKFFDSIDHDILLKLIEQKISDTGTLKLIRVIISSFEKLPGKGLPLGNVTSQLFANLYLHELDFYMKQRLRTKYYLRYCDDFIIVGSDARYLFGLIPQVQSFLSEKLKLKLHPYKVSIRSYYQGIDFLGYVIRPYHRILRTKTKHRMLRLVTETNQPSYFGILSHCAGHKIREQIVSNRL